MQLHGIDKDHCMCLCVYVYPLIWNPSTLKRSECLVFSCLRCSPLPQSFKSVHLSRENKLSLSPSTSVSACVRFCLGLVLAGWNVAAHARSPVCIYKYIYIYKHCACRRVCKAVNLSSPTPSKKIDSPLRRMLQRKITTPADKHTLVSVQTHTSRQRRQGYAFV